MTCLQQHVFSLHIYDQELFSYITFSCPSIRSFLLFISHTYHSTADNLFDIRHIYTHKLLMVAFFNEISIKFIVQPELVFFPPSFVWFTVIIMHYSVCNTQNKCLLLLLLLLLFKLYEEVRVRISISIQCYMILIALHIKFIYIAHIWEL